jgi:hypothetical protein
MAIPEHCAFVGKRTQLRFWTLHFSASTVALLVLLAADMFSATATGEKLLSHRRLKKGSGKPSFFNQTITFVNF